MADGGNLMRVTITTPDGLTITLDQGDRTDEEFAEWVLAVLEDESAKVKQEATR